jgi:hypothetical protein
VTQKQRFPAPGNCLGFPRPGIGRLLLAVIPDVGLSALRNAHASHPGVLAAQRRERARIRSERPQRWGRPET